MPDRGVDRPPFADEIQQARRYATRLRQAITHGTRADRQAHARRALRRARLRARTGAARDRPAGQRPPVAGHPPGARADRGPARRAGHRHLRLDARVRVRARADRLDPHRRPAPDRRALRQRAVRQRRRTARRRQPRRCRSCPGIATGGGTAFAGDAIELVCEQLEMTNPRRPRFVYVLSDGGWADTPRRRREDPLARRARRSDHPPQHRDRAAVGRMRPHHRHHRPRRRARPDRRRHRQRAARPPAHALSGGRRSSHTAPRPAAVKLLHTVEATAPGSGSSWTSTRSTHLTH